MPQINGPTAGLAALALAGTLGLAGTVGAGTIGAGTIGGGSTGQIGSGTVGGGTIGAPTGSTGPSIDGGYGDGTYGSGYYGDPTPAYGPNVTGVTATLTVTATAPAGTVEAFQIDRSDADTLTLVLANPIVVSQPGALALTIGNGKPNAQFFVYLDGVQVANAYLTQVGTLDPYLLPIRGLELGDHTVGVNTTATLPADVLLFTTLTDDSTVTTVVEPALPPKVTTPLRWVLQSYLRYPAGHVPPAGTTFEAGFETYVFPFNPETLNRRYGELAVTDQPVVTGGRTVSWEGAGNPVQWSWSGRALTPQDYQSLVYWARDNRRVWLTDHLGDRYLMLMDAIKLERVRDGSRRWHHKYTITAYVLSGPGEFA